MAEKQAQPAGQLIADDDATYRVEIHGSGESFACPADRPLLYAAIRADVLMPSSCRGGQCGTCRGRVLAGRVDYPGGRPEALSAAEEAAGYALFCRAHARSDLTIELPQRPF